MLKLAKNKPLLQHLIYYTIYCALVWGVHLLLISVIAFFHFLLDHNLKIIEEWIYDQGWFVIIISKTVGFFIVLKLINLKSDSLFPFRKFMEGGGLKPNREMMIVVIFLLFFVVWLGRPAMPLDLEFNIFRAVLSYLGTLFFYAPDFLIVALLNYYDPTDSRLGWVEVITFPLLFLVWQKGIFLYERGVDFWVYFHLFFCLFLGVHFSKNWTLPLFYLLLFAAPVSSLMGVDPVWREDFSLLRLTRPIEPSFLVALIFLNIGYLYFKRKSYRYK